MANYSAGTGLLEILPSLKGFHRTMRAELKTINPEVVVGFAADTKRVTRQIAQVTRPRTIQMRVEANTAALKKAEHEVVDAEKRMAGARDASSDATKRLQIAEQQLDELRAKGNAKRSQISSAELKLAQAKRAAAAASNDAANAESALNAARTAAKDAKVKLQTDVDTAAATGKLQAFSQRAGRAYRLRLGVDPDLTGAAAQLATFKATASKLASIHPHVDLDAGAALAKLTALSAAGAGIGTGIAGGVGVAGAAIATLPALIAAVLGPVAALTAGINGVPAAFKAFSDAEDQAAQSATSNAKSQRSAAQQIVSARQQVTQAQTQLSRAYEDASVAQAGAARRVQDAERQVIDAERAHLRARQDLTRAIDDAKRAQQELAFQVQGGALAERQAVLDLADAERALDAARASGATGADLERVQIAYEQQALSLDEIRARNQQLADDKAKSDAAGIQGADQVVAAQERVADAARGVTDAEQGVRDAQTEAARTQIQSQRSIADAQAQVAQAQQQLANALVDAGTVGAAATDKINAALQKLSPNAREFVTSVRGLKPEFDALKTSAQDALFAGLGPAFADFGKQTLPAMATNLASVSGAINTVTKDMLEFLATKDTADKFGQLFAGINQVITASGPVVQTFVGLFLDLATAAMPGIVALVQAIGTIGTALSSALQPLIQSGAITQAVTLIADLLTALAPIIGMVVAQAIQLWNAVGPALISTIQALAPVVFTLLSLFVQVAPVLARIVQEIASALLPVVEALAPVISALLPVITTLISSGLQILVPLIQVGAQLFLALAPAIQAVAGVIAALVPVVVPLITQLAVGLLPLVRALTPLIVQLAQVFAQGLTIALTTLVPFIVQVVQALLPLIPTIMSIITQLVEGLLPIFQPLMDSFLQLVLAVLPLLPPLLQLADALLPALIALIGSLMPIITILAQIFVDVLAGAINGVVVPALNVIVGVVRTVSDVFKFLYDKVVKPVWDGIGSVISTVWNTAIKPIFDAIGTALDAMGKAWQKLGDIIGGIWTGIKKLVHAGIQGIIDIFWNKSLREVVNLLPGVDIPEFKVPEFAQGGIVPGYAPGRDSVLSLLSPGEGVLVPEFVRLVGPATIEAWNRMAMAGRRGYSGGGIVSRFADGGIVAAGPTPTNAPPPVTIDPAAIAALGDVAAKVSEQIAVLTTTIVTGLVPAVADLSTQIRTIGVPALDTYGQHTIALATLSEAQWTRITLAVNTSVSAQTLALQALQNGLSAVRAAIQSTADWAVSQFDRIRAAAADPIRWALQFPINAGLINAWNTIDGQFSLGRHVNPVAIPFAFGGRVFGPGTSTSDSINARLSVGEFVIQTAIAKRIYPFLNALNAGKPEALQAAGYATGGIVADTGSQLNAALARGIAFARAQDGKPYIWGGVGPDGYDCSGFMSAITNVLRGENPHHRLGVAASQPWPGFVAGLSSAFATGFSSTHTAGTLAGINVESGGSPSRVKFGIGAAGADHPQFGGHASLPIVGGQFVPGGGGIDFTALVGPTFADTYRLIGQISTLFAANIMATQAAGIATTATDAVKAAAVSALTALTSSTGVAGSPEVVAAVRAVAARFGWGTGPQWDALSWIIGRESGWNPNAANPTSSARGLFQKMTSVHGPLELTPALQAEWGLNYIRSRYGDPIGAKAFWQSHNWYDQGGVATGVGWMYKGTPEPERVLSPAQTRAFDSLVAAVSAQGIPTAPQADTGPGQFTGQLYLDSGELLGVVRGEIDQANNAVAAEITRGTR